VPARGHKQNGEPGIAARLAMEVSQGPTTSSEPLGWICYRTLPSIRVSLPDLMTRKVTVSSSS